MARKRPWLVTFLALGVLTSTSLYGIRLVQTVRQWAFLRSLPLAVSPGYLAGSGLVFGLAGGLVAWGVWRGARWAPRAARGYALAAAAFSWFDRLVAASASARAVADSGRANWPFALAITLAVLAALFAGLSLPAVAAYFAPPAPPENPPSTLPPPND